VRLAGGLFHTCGVDTDGSLWCWGRNEYGQAGDGTSANNRPTPVEVAAPAGVTFVDVAAGFGHTCALDTDGTAWCWGSDSKDQLGNEGYAPSSSPIEVDRPTGVTFTDIEVGSDHSCAVDTEGVAWCWGDNAFGQLGTGDVGGYGPTPARVEMPPDVAFTTVSLGLLHTCALDTEGRAWCWGYNSLGELGDGNQGTPAPAPIQVATPEGIVLVDLGLGMSHSCAIDDSGLGWCWGYNDQGQLGGGISGSRDIPDVV